MPNIGLSQLEVKSTVIIFLIYMFRMLGIFMIFPILSIFLNDYGGATPFFIGLALGIWGLTNAIFQIPLGMLSDFIGRKKVIILGLIIFIIGSLIAATATDITNIILGRSLQGVGAIAGTLMALISDVSSEKNRTTIMAFIGVGIGFSFFISFLLGPIIGHAFNLSGVFIAGAIFSLISIVLILFFPDTNNIQSSRTFKLSEIKILFNNKEILSHFIGIFILHLILTACFVAIPITLTDIHHIDSNEYPQIFSFILSMSLILIIPMLVFERKEPQKARFYSTFLLLCSLIVMTIFYSNPVYTIFSLVIFMGAFSVIEASLPSSTSKIVPINSRGSSMGFFSTFQFLGTFAGGVIGGFILSSSSLSVIFLVCAIISGIWLLTSFVQMNYR
tara:strand:+ start:1386 stop:2552 length:1167 start_codon:yes stop_codon:yes gene_type:complete